MQKFRVTIVTGEEAKFLYGCLQQLAQFKTDIKEIFVEEHEDHDMLMRAVTSLDLPEVKIVSMADIDGSPASTDPYIHMTAADYWTYVGWSKMKNLVRHYRDIDCFSVRARSFFWNPFFYCVAKSPMVFRQHGFVKRKPIELSNMALPPNSDEYFCYNYRFIDPVVTMNLVRNFDDGEWRNCGSDWFHRIYLSFDGTIEGALECMERNFGTLHPWGRISPGWRGDEFAPQVDQNPEHPQGIRQYFGKRQFKTQDVRFI